MAYITESHGLPASILSRVADFFGEWAKNFADARAIEQTFNELNRLSDRELDDLGIARSDIAGIARDSVHGQ